MTQKTFAGERPLTIDVSRRDGSAVIRVTGSAAMDCTERLRAALFAVADEKLSQIVLDLTDLDFICSDGLGVIVAMHLRSYRHASVIKLVAPSPPVVDVFRRTRLNDVFPSYASVEQALEA